MASKTAGVSSGISRPFLIFAIGAAILGGITGIQKFIEATPYFTYIHLMLITAPLSVAVAIVTGSWIFQKYELSAIAGVFVILGGAVVGVLLNLAGHSQLEQALLGKTVCVPQHYGSYTLGCQYEQQGTPDGILGAVWNVLHAYWVVYGVVNFLLAIAGGTMLAWMGKYVSEH
jgi:hypothetical protein